VRVYWSPGLPTHYWHREPDCWPKKHAVLSVSHNMLFCWRCLRQKILLRPADNVAFLLDWAIHSGMYFITLDYWHSGLDYWYFEIKCWQCELEYWKCQIEYWHCKLGYWHCEINYLHSNQDYWHCKLDYWQSGLNYWHLN